MSEVLTIDEPTVRAMVARAGVSASVERVLRRTGGRLSGVYEAQLGGGDAVIVKVYEPQWAWKQAKEIHVHGLLAAQRELTCRIPQVLGSAGAGNPTGHSYTVLTKVDGTPLSEIDVELTSADRQAIYRQIGKLLRAVHRVPQAGFGYLVTEILDPAFSNKAYVQRQFDRKLCEFVERGGPGALARAVEHALTTYHDVLAVPVEPVLCHNDMHEGNILVARNGNAWSVQGFVDVENAVAADPMSDLAKTDYYSVQGDAAKRDGLLDGYGPVPDDLPARLRLYRLYHALELWDWFAKIGQPQHLPGILADLEEFTAA